MTYEYKIKHENFNLYNLIALSLLVDSYFWQKEWMWPEGHVYFFNIILGKSVEWGVCRKGFIYLILKLLFILL